MDDKDCLFCKIVAGDLPCYKVYEDENYIGFLDIHPKTKGDTLLVTKTHHTWTYDVPAFGEYWETARTLSNRIMRVLGADWVNYFTYGYIPHAHIHILPRYGEMSANENHAVIPKEISIDQEELKKIADSIYSQD